MSTDIVTQEQPKEHMSWERVNWEVEKAIAKMRGVNYHPKRIIPIGGGGIIPAAILAYRYYKKDGLRPIELMPPVYAKSYGHDNKQHALDISIPDNYAEYDNSDTLFVDDIMDTGQTLRAVSEFMPNAHYFVLVTKIAGQPHWYSLHDPHNKWWVFPWEKV